MTSLAPSPQIVAMVQAATTLPVFLFAILAGAVADIVDRRNLLLVFTFFMGRGAAFIAPAWQAIVPKLVPRG